MHAIHLLVCKWKIKVTLKFEKITFCILCIVIGNKVDENEMALFIIINGFLKKIFNFFFLLVIFRFFGLRSLVIILNCLVALVFHDFNPIYLFFVRLVVDVQFGLMVPRTSHRLMYHLLLLLAVILIKCFFKFFLSINVFLYLIPLIVRICLIFFFSFLIFPYFWLFILNLLDLFSFHPVSIIHV